MTALGILVVQPDWHPGAPATIDKTTYLHHRDALQPGTRFLVYVKEPVDAIVAEAEVKGAAMPGEPDLEGAAFNAMMPTNEHVQQSSQSKPPEIGSFPMAATGIDQRVFEIPYQRLRSGIDIPPIPLGTIQTRLGSEFSVFDEEWIPLTDEQYNALIAEWEGSKR